MNKPELEELLFDATLLMQDSALGLDHYEQAVLQKNCGRLAYHVVEQLKGKSNALQ